ncbi:SRPBCC family protein [Micromonospora sp. KC606]|uniref:SRPBCC family protein n=1 Tax=Micromonospora sp. KC606 TaxID=2530379 RepID=UPI001046E9B7|nr:SRPBCC family protein [Micromonospora sp. KC606]TDC84228.1 SRPBCC family protein [Micromonospora sp. KC606]
MTLSIVEKSPLFDLRGQIPVNADPGQVYAVVSDLTRSSEWSPECRGGEWISGEPAAVGAVFRGENLRSEDVVGWAPLVRGTWYTEARIIAAEPGRTFQWAMLTHAGENQSSVWGFDLEPAARGCVLVHHFRMERPTEGIYKIVADLDEDERERFIREWSEKLAQDIAWTLGRIKSVIEG